MQCGGAVPPAACAWREKEGCGRPPGVVNAIPLLCSPTWKRVATLLVLNREGELPAGLCGLAGGGVSILVGALLPLGARGGAGGVALSPWWWAWVGGNDFPR